MLCPAGTFVLRLGDAVRQPRRGRGPPGWAQQVQAREHETRIRGLGGDLPGLGPRVERGRRPGVHGPPRGGDPGPEAGVPVQREQERLAAGLGAPRGGEQPDARQGSGRLLLVELAEHGGGQLDEVGADRGGQGDARPCPGIARGLGRPGGLGFAHVAASRPAAAPPASPRL